MKLKNCIVITFFLFSCNMIGAGTHGSLKGYRYVIPKEKLESALMNLINNDPNIYRDTTNRDYYNDGKTYLTIKINNNEIENEYTIRYYGNQEDWQGSQSSGIFICYAYDKYGRGGDQENGKTTMELKKELINVFEVFFINKLDKKLDIKHIEEI